MLVEMTGSSYTQSGYSTDEAGSVTATGWMPQRTRICSAALDRQTMRSGILSSTSASPSLS